LPGVHLPETIGVLILAVLLVVWVWLTALGTQPNKQKTIKIISEGRRNFFIKLKLNKDYLFFFSGLIKYNDKIGTKIITKIIAKPPKICIKK
jgi:hypothetical protein